MHSYTHPNPEFIFVCPVSGCKYESDVGNFRVYKHIKAVHPDFAAETFRQLQPETALKVTQIELETESSLTNTQLPSEENPVMQSETVSVRNCSL